MIAEALPLSVVAAPVALSVGAVLALVLCDLREFKAGRYLFKPLAAAAFIWLALALGATSSDYGRLLTAGLVCCMIGDLLLMPDGERTFTAGLGAFLCGHLLFAVAFLQLPSNLYALMGIGLPALLLLVLVRRWLEGHVPSPMKIPVALYTLVITGMLVSSAMTVGNPAAPWIIVGAWGFAGSDLAVARRQFINPSRFNALWGTPLYFFSQMVLAATVALG